MTRVNSRQLLVDTIRERIEAEDERDRGQRGVRSASGDRGWRLQESEDDVSDEKAKPLTGECEHCEAERERRRKVGGYWLTPEGRAEIRATWDDPEDGAIPLTLLNSLEAVEAERDAAIAGANGATAKAERATQDWYRSNKALRETWDERDKLQREVERLRKVVEAATSLIEASESIRVLAGAFVPWTNLATAVLDLDAETSG